MYHAATSLSAIFPSNRRANFTRASVSQLGRKISSDLSSFPLPTEFAANKVK
ncbi:hypothetical protein WN48_09730 [Eufriesea mexicana]|uniref:Uncharacterized protein n=1 Tax=Eufriesea mexicana TaxID=516756 RepID=A0A310S9P1_9HYME|nr:hypothetical protein WN48_09730 [Eufriesea mexicana]